MGKRKKKLNKIFNKFIQIQSLYITQNQAIQYCEENKLNNFHIQELSSLITKKLQHAITELDLFVLKL